MPRRPTRYYPDYGPLLPTSGPDWRWARALEIVASQKNASLPRDGLDIVRAIRFIRRINKLVTRRGMRRLLRVDADLTMAYQIAKEGGRRLLELQCRVLARQSTGVIAIEMGIPQPIIETYCLIFFDVAGRLNASSFIHQRVIGVTLGQPPTPETLMMQCAYHRGPEMIEPWLDYLDHQLEAHDLSTPEGRMRESIDLLLTVHCLDTRSTNFGNLVRQIGNLAQTGSKVFHPLTARRVISESISRKMGETLWRPASNSQLDCEDRQRRASKVPAKAQTLRVA